MNLSPSCPADRNSSVVEQCAWRWRHISTKQTAPLALQSAFSCLIYLKRLHSLKCMFIKWLLVLNWQQHVTYRYYSPIILCLWSNTSLFQLQISSHRPRKRGKPFFFTHQILTNHFYGEILAWNFKLPHCQSKTHERVSLLREPTTSDKMCFYRLNWISSQHPREPEWQTNRWTQLVGFQTCILRQSEE